MKISRNARTPRFYHDEELHSQTELELSKKASHHLVTVMRMKERDKLELFNGDGYNYAATITHSGLRTPGKRARLTIEKRSKAKTESPLPIILVQAISRGDRMDTCIRQSIELGVNHIYPVYSRHSVKPLDDNRTEKKLAHWHNIIISACEQSGRATVPPIENPISLAQWLENNAAETAINASVRAKTRADFILSPHSNNTLAEHLISHGSTINSCALIIGPESGFEEDEIAHATSQGVHSVKFGHRILRTETAGPACVAVMQSMLGDLKQI